MNRVVVLRRLASTVSSGPSAAPVTTTGIEHATALKKISPKPADWSQYKCAEYLHYKTYSYYDPEIAMLPSRASQPTNKKPDVMPSFKKQ